MANEISKNWIPSKLSSVIKLKNGYAFKSNSYSENGIPVIRISDIQDGVINTDNSVRLKEFEKGEDFLIEQGDILIAMSGATTGKFGIYSSSEKAYQNQRVGNLKLVNPIIEKKFVYYLISTLKKQIEETAYGGAQPNISGKLIENLDILLPPLEDQKQIVKKLDQLFGHLENIKARLEKIPELLKQFRQAVLTQAVTGRLTEDINKGQKYSWCSLDHYCESSFYGPRFSKEEYQDFGYPTVRTTDMTESGYLEIKSDTPRVKIDDLKKLELYKVCEGDLLVTRTGSIGKMARYFGKEIVIPSAYLIRFRFTKNALSDFIYYCLTSPYGQKEMGLNATALTQPNLNAQKIRSIKIPEIPVSEQKEIVLRINALFSQADKIENRYKKLKEQIDQLHPALLAKAFRGEIL